jgi:hypothetical protein
MLLGSDVFQCDTFTRFFYLIFITFPFGIFSLCWVVTTFSVSAALLVLPFIGYPLLVLSAITWRALAQLELAIFDLFFPSPLLIDFRMPVKVIPDRESFFSMGNEILRDKYTWISFGYFVGVKSWFSTLLFCIAIVLLSIMPISMCCCPMLLILIRELSQVEPKVGRNILVQY